MQRADRASDHCDVREPSGYLEAHETSVVAFSETQKTLQADPDLAAKLASRRCTHASQLGSTSKDRSRGGHSLP